MRFINEKHETNFNILLKRSRIDLRDCERKAFFYIIASNQDLLEQIDKIYDFNKNLLRETVEDEDGNRYFKDIIMSSSTKRLLNLAIQLYNSYLNNQSVVDTFSFLDSNNFEIAINSIKIRFDR